MSRLTLTKSAIDFAFENYQADAITLAEKSIAAFKAAGGRSEDLILWNNSVQQNIQVAFQASKQKLPSEIADAQKAAEQPATPASNTSAVSVEPAK